jgi:Transposase DDE domain group 1
VGPAQFLHTGAYWLLHQLRRAAPRHSPWRNATFETLRRAFLKVAVRIEELKSRVRIALPSAYPYRQAMISMAGNIAAQGP